MSRNNLINTPPTMRDEKCRTVLQPVNNEDDRSRKSRRTSGRRRGRSLSMKRKSSSHSSQPEQQQEKPQRQRSSSRSSSSRRTAASILSAAFSRSRSTSRSTSSRRRRPTEAKPLIIPTAVVSPLASPPLAAVPTPISTNTNEEPKQTTTTAIKNPKGSSSAGAVSPAATTNTPTTASPCLGGTIFHSPGHATAAPVVLDTVQYPNVLPAHQFGAATGHNNNHSLVEKIITEIGTSWTELLQKGKPLPRLVSVQGDIMNDELGIEPLYRDMQDYQPELISWTPTVKALRDLVSNVVLQPLNHAVICFYRHGEDYLSETSSPSLDLFTDSSIVKLSLGAPRTMILRPKRKCGTARRPSPRPTTKIQLAHGSILSLGPQTNQAMTYEIKRLSQFPTPSSSPTSVATAKTSAVAEPHEDENENEEDDYQKDSHPGKSHRRNQSTTTVASTAVSTITDAPSFSSSSVVDNTNIRICITFRHVATFQTEQGQIFGKGATCATLGQALTAKPPSVESSERMNTAIQAMKAAFLLENRDSAFDCQKHYSCGFDALPFHYVSSSPSHLITGHPREPFLEEKEQQCSIAANQTDSGSDQYSVKKSGLVDATTTMGTVGASQSDQEQQHDEIVAVQDVPEQAMQHPSDTDGTPDQNNVPTSRRISLNNSPKLVSSSSTLTPTNDAAKSHDSRESSQGSSILVSPLLSSRKGQGNCDNFSIDSKVSVCSTPAASTPKRNGIFSKLTSRVVTPSSLSGSEGGSPSSKRSRRSTRSQSKSKNGSSHSGTRRIGRPIERRRSTSAMGESDRKNRTWFNAGKYMPYNQNIFVKRQEGHPDMIPSLQNSIETQTFSDTSSVYVEDQMLLSTPSRSSLAQYCNSVQEKPKSSPVNKKSGIALLVLDLQNDYLSDDPSFFYGKMGSPFSSRREGLLKRITEHAKEVRRYGGVVFMVKSQFGAWSSPQSQKLRRRMSDPGAHMDRVDCCGVSTAGSGFHPDVEMMIVKQDVILIKEWYSAFMGTTLDQQLKKLQVGNVVVCGVTTDHSVAATVRSAANLGYNVFLSSDGTAQVDEVMQKVTERRLEKYCTAVVEKGQSLLQVIKPKSVTEDQKSGSITTDEKVDDADSLEINVASRLSGFGAGDSIIVPDFLDQCSADDILRKILQSTASESNWNKITDLGGTALTTAYHLEPNEQGHLPVYRSNAPQPWDLNFKGGEFPDAVRQLKSLTETQTGHKLNWGQVLCYRSGSEGSDWDADKNLDVRAGSTIAAVSLGGDRVLHLKPKKADSSLLPQRIRLEHNSLVLLGPETTRLFLRSLPANEDSSAPHIHFTFLDVATYFSKNESRTGIPALYGQGAEYSSYSELQEAEASRRMVEQLGMTLAGVYTMTTLPPGRGGSLTFTLICTIVVAAGTAAWFRRERQNAWSEHQRRLSKLFEACNQEPLSLEEARHHIFKGSN